MPSKILLTCVRFQYFNNLLVKFDWICGNAIEYIIHFFYINQFFWVFIIPYRLLIENIIELEGKRVLCDRVGISRFRHSG